MQDLKEGEDENFLKLFANTKAIKGENLFLINC